MISSQEHSNHQQKHSFSIGGKLLVEYKSIKLVLHQSFTTAHSESSTRTNFVIRISQQLILNENKAYGYGQCGLPPKKPGIYLSNIEDCFQFMEVIKQQISLTIKTQTTQQKKEVREQYFAHLKTIAELCKNKKIFENLKQILSKPEQFQSLLLLSIIWKHKQQNFRAPKSAIQFTTLDFLANKFKQDFFELLYGIKQQDNNIRNTYSFYTISLSDNSSMLKNIIKHLKYSRFIKIKYDTNIQELLKLLEQIVRYQHQNLKNKNKEQQYQEIKFIIDANCSWKPDTYERFQKKLVENASNILQQKILNKILYIEQPYDFDITEYQKWKDIKKSTKLKILADESFRNQEDISKVMLVSHAINIKCEKAGGFFNTLKSALLALSLQASDKIDVVFGTMVSTQLGCSQTYMLAPFAEYLDADGSLLVADPNINGGFSWNQQSQSQKMDHSIVGRLLRNQKSYGLGISQKQCKSLFQ